MLLGFDKQFLVFMNILKSTNPLLEINPSCILLPQLTIYEAYSQKQLGIQQLRQ